MVFLDDEVSTNIVLVRNVLQVTRFKCFFDHFVQLWVDGHQLNLTVSCRLASFWWDWAVNNKNLCGVLQFTPVLLTVDFVIGFVVCGRNFADRAFIAICSQARNGTVLTVDLQFV
ncbi:hypothetical protein D3C85_1428640 [compost metagenome]